MPIILVVDDDPDILYVVETILVLEGYIVHAVPRGEDVLPFLATTRPNLILMDVMIAGTDGRDLCRVLKAHINHKSIPIVLFSASYLSAVEVLACGADDFLTKPFDLDNLVKAIGHLAPAPHP